MLVAVVSTIAGVLVAAMLAFFAWLAVSIMNLRAGQLALETSLEEGQKRIVSELRGEFAVALARMEARLMAAICGRGPPPRESACDERDDWLEKGAERVRERPRRAERIRQPLRSSRNSFSSKS